MRDPDRARPRPGFPGIVRRKYPAHPSGRLDTPDDLRILYRRLQTGGQRKKNALNGLDPVIARNRVILYCLAASALLAGLFFVFF